MVFEFAPIEALARRQHPDPDPSDADLARALGIDRRTIGRYRVDGVNAFAADRMLTRLGYHPALVFSDWGTARRVCAEYRRRRKIAA